MVGIRELMQTHTILLVHSLNLDPVSSFFDAVIIRFVPPRQSGQCWAWKGGNGAEEQAVSADCTKSHGDKHGQRKQARPKVRHSIVEIG